MILRVPDYYEEFSCIASQCKDSCCAGWEIDIDEESYAYYRSCEDSFGERLRDSMYIAEDGGYRFKLKGHKRCAMLNDNNLCDLYTALGEEALCEVCTEYPRFSLFYGDVQQKALSLSCEEVGRILFSREEKVHFVDHKMPDYYEDGEAAEEDEEEDRDYIDFLEWAQNEGIAILQNRDLSIPDRMCAFLFWFEEVQKVTNRYQAHEDREILEEWRRQKSGERERTVPSHRRILSYTDFQERFLIFEEMEELDAEWIHSKQEFRELYSEESYERILTEYLESADYSEIWYEQLLVYFVSRYFMNAAYDYDAISYAKLVIVATLVIRDMDAARFRRNHGTFALFDRIDIARIFSKEVEHSEGNAEELKEMCMMEEIASVEALYRQI